MKKVKNARIKEVEIGLLDGEMLVCRFKLEYTKYGATWYEFALEEEPSSEVAKLSQLLRYANIKDVKDLESRIIRVVQVVAEIEEDENIQLYALGSGIEDSFFKLDGEFAIVTEEEIMKD